MNLGKLQIWGIYTRFNITTKPVVLLVLLIVVVIVVREK